MPESDAQTWMAERLILIHLLDDDYEYWTPAELRRELSDLPAQAVRDGLNGLEEEGVAIRRGEHVRASRCARRMDALRPVSI